MSNIPLSVVARELLDHYRRAGETEQIIIGCATTATVADAVGGAIPGLAIPATIVSCVGAVWAMYGILCSTLGISIKKNVLKLLARAAITNIAANLGGALIAMFAGMFIPGASIIVSAAVTFITVYLAGFIFLKLILKMAKKSNDPYSFSDINESEMKRMVHDEKLTKEDLNAAKSVYEKNKK